MIRLIRRISGRRFPPLNGWKTTCPVALILGFILAIGCDAPPAPPVDLLDRGHAYVHSAAARRGALEAALVNPANGYSVLRLAQYTEQAWGALPLWNPPTRPMAVGEAIPARLDDARPLDYEGVGWDLSALERLGERAFFEYPVQLAPALARAAADPARYGLSARDGRVETVLWADSPGGVFPAFTCATCHATRGAGGDWIPGKTNAALDYGRLLDDFHGIFSPQGEWGPARVDVTPDALFNPTVVTDLRPVAYQARLHRAGTLYNDPIALAVRLETLLITSSGRAVRPPREIVFALVVYLWRLADALPSVPQGGAGRAVFEATCAECHGGPGLAGAATSLAEVGTDPAVGESTMRGTGTYRISSLRGVGDRTPLLAGGGVADLATLLDPDRAAPGHAYGFDLDSADRAALLAFLAAL